MAQSARMREAIRERRAGILTYGLTPPKLSYPADKRAWVAERQAKRIAELPVDGVVVYDLQDESERIAEARPFPFLETIPSIDYALDDLAAVEVPKVVYTCVAKQSRQALRERQARLAESGDLAVFVGAASSRARGATSLREAYTDYGGGDQGVPLGGVLIAERHASAGGEDERVLRKMDAGCSFFITQAVYSVVATKDALSDLYYRAEADGRPMPPVLVTLSPCGSTKTLAFLRWLGVVVPRWLENELLHADDTLSQSVEACTEILEELHAFAASKRIPLGCNVESVSLRKAEIDASVELVHRARRILG